MGRGQNPSLGYYRWHTKVEIWAVVVEKRYSPRIRITLSFAATSDACVLRTKFNIELWTALTSILTFYKVVKHTHTHTYTQEHFRLVQLVECRCLLCEKAAFFLYYRIIGFGFALKRTLRWVFADNNYQLIFLPFLAADVRLSRKYLSKIINKPEWTES